MRVAVVQLRSTPVVDDNLAAISRVIDDASQDGARLVALPENAPLLAPEAARLEAAEPVDGRQISTIRNAAARRGAWVLVGSFAESGPDARHTWNTSVLIDPSGDVAALYRKIHLFDVDIAPDTRHHESASVAPGPPTPVVADVDGWKLGLSICYDLRFPELYRALVAAGADILAVPAAFTVRTGAAHWHTLLRARAIENQCYVVAPAQVGTHFGARESYGHALIAGPWGEVVAEVEGGPGWAIASPSRDRVSEVRASLPCLSHRRL